MWNASERKGAPIQFRAQARPVVMAEGGEKTQPRPERKASEVGLRAFLRLIKDIRGRLARYFSLPSVNRGAQPPPVVSYRRKWMKESSSSFDLLETLLSSCDRLCSL